MLRVAPVFNPSIQILKFTEAMPIVSDGAAALAEILSNEKNPARYPTDNEE